MSRRKQLNPRHLETDQALAGSLLQNDDGLDSQSEDEIGGDEHICGRCRAEFVELAEFLGHKKRCARKRIVLVVNDEDGLEAANSDQEDFLSFNTSSYFRDLEFNGDMVQKRHEDLENNNTYDKDFSMDRSPSHDDGLDADIKDVKDATRHGSLSYNQLQLVAAIQGLSDSNVAIEALHNTKVAVAQFPLNAGLRGNNGSHVSPDAVVLQSTLYSLQQQQLLQLQLIQQLQQQLDTQKSNGLQGSAGVVNNAGLTLNGTGSSSSSNSSSNGTIPMSTLSSTLGTLASSVAAPSSELNQPNSLELLQRSAQQVLNNASQGLLANGLDFSKGKASGSASSLDSKGMNSMGRNDEPFFKHRCRFCGKVFGSDSALQIHIRSHTGERPFKCNVCGNRFSTRGNLKVHFQRHKAKYPHIKMNPNPVPEHLDRFHPPLIAQEAQTPRPSPHSERPPSNFSPSPLPPTLSRQSPIPGPLDLGPKSHVTAPTLLPTTSQDIRQESESPLSINKALSLAHSDDSRENSVDRSLSPALSIKSEDRAKSASPMHADDSSKDSMIMKSADRTPTPEHLKSMAISSPILKHNHFPAVTSYHNSITPLSTSTSFTSGHSLSTLSAASALHLSTLPLTDPALDPAVYTPLLPKPGSNDNSWESLIEITKTSETSKLQQLVDNIEHKLSDPNQCVICHRVLSCKSALQMHYRTHTGERPFKCKICGRAFTTKGNLKTHMGVHRAKPPMRVLHQCPVCHKKFSNALVLQQHIRMHTGEPTDLSPEQIQAAEVKEFPPSLHPALPHLIPPPTSTCSPVTLMPSAMMKHNSLPPVASPGESPGPPFRDMGTPESESVIKSSSSLSEGEKSSDGESIAGKSMYGGSGGGGGGDGNGGGESIHGVPASAIVPTFSTSLAALENHVKAINTSVASHMSSYGGLMTLSGSTLHHHSHHLHRHHHHHHLPISHPEESSSPSPNAESPRNGDKSPDLMASPLHPRNSEQMSPSVKVESPSPGVTASSASQTAHSAASPATVISVANSEHHSMSGALDLTPKTSVITSMVSGELGCLPGTSFPCVPLPPHMLSPGTPRLSNTTCNICFKTFACHSALEIHCRSHTKERPFKCNACDRAFSTKGNMRQHMLTHKIRDLPPQLFDSKTGINSNNNNNNTITTTNNNNNSISAICAIAATAGASSSATTTTTTTSSGSNNAVNHSSPMDISISPELLAKRPHNDGDTLMPIPKRPPGLPKRLCHVCSRNFSGASALQIHMRTHTGDRPFKCSICERAFTTRGNLKVHMGTHVWNNGTSRRGRRMSIDLPPIPLTAKDSEFMQRRPDLYFPFMASPFMNGLATRVNEISVIQSAAVNNGGLTSPPMGLVPTSNELCPIMKSNAPTTPTSTSTPTPTSTPDLDLSMKKPLLNDDQLHHGFVPSSIRASPPGMPSDDQPADMSKSTSWVWKLACNLCNKVCSSPGELDSHLQGHYKAERKTDSDLGSPKSENITV